jgi:hypothetical protein
VDPDPAVDVLRRVGFSRSDGSPPHPTDHHGDEVSLPFPKSAPEPISQTPATSPSLAGSSGSRLTDHIIFKKKKKKTKKKSPLTDPRLSLPPPSDVSSFALTDPQSHGPHDEALTRHLVFPVLDFGAHS